MEIISIIPIYCEEKIGTLIALLLADIFCFCVGIKERDKSHILWSGLAAITLAIGLFLQEPISQEITVKKQTISTEEVAKELEADVIIKEDTFVIIVPNDNFDYALTYLSSI